jgi:DNA-binding transcriptional MerR regulator
MTEDLILEDLVDQSGLSIRTLRYYMQEGLTRTGYSRKKCQVFSISP